MDTANVARGHHVQRFFAAAEHAARQIDTTRIEHMIQLLKAVQDRKGRVFVLGAGGSAANASHMVNDLRKLCRLEAYCPTDNVAEITARVNDDGWDTAFFEYLVVSRLCDRDAIFVLSVGGGDIEKGVSVGLIRAIQYAKTVKAMTLGIVGRREGFTFQNGDCVVAIPLLPEAAEWVTPLSEAFQAVVWHSIVSSPKLQQVGTKW